MFVKRVLPALFILLLSLSVGAQSKNKAAVIAKINKVIDSLHANVGFAVTGLDFHDSIIINGQKHFPMQSVYKFPLALSVLNKTGRGQMPLNMNIHIPEGRLDPDTWSPILKDFPKGDINMTLLQVLTYAISKSDNNACDILFGFMGGTTVVQKYLDSIGVKGINVAATEAEMKKGWDVQYTNWAEPVAMLQLLRRFYNGALLDAENNRLLMKLMIESENPETRIKGLLPAGTEVAHKTGTSDTNEQGVKAATNDVGIIKLPNGKHIAMVVFVSDYKGGINRGERVIAELARLAYDYYK